MVRLEPLKDAPQVRKVMPKIHIDVSAIAEMGVHDGGADTTSTQAETTKSRFNALGHSTRRGDAAKKASQHMLDQFTKTAPASNEYRSTTRKRRAEAGQIATTTGQTALEVERDRQLTRRTGTMALFGAAMKAKLLEGLRQAEAEKAAKDVVPDPGNAMGKAWQAKVGLLPDASVHLPATGRAAQTKRRGAGAAPGATQPPASGLQFVELAVNAVKNTAVAGATAPAKNAQLTNQFQQYLKEYLTEHKDLDTALAMANRAGMLMNDIQIGKLLELSHRARERFKLIIDTQSFDPSAALSREPLAALTKDGSAAMDKKINMLRCQKGALRTAL